MKRRSFLAGSLGAALPAGASVWPVPAVYGEEPGKAEDGDGYPPSQSNDGVVVHPFESEVMRGNPPSKENFVTLDTYETIRGHRVWAQQHMRELCPTQNISRGKGPVAVLPRKTTDVGSMRVKDLNGGKLTVRQLLDKSFTDAFIVLHKGCILSEEYFSGMRADTPHRIYSAGKSLLADVVAGLLDEGKLQEHVNVVEYVPELAGSAYAGATIRDLLDMQSGVKYEYDLESGHNSMTEHGRHFRAAGMFRKLPGEHPDAGQYDFFVSLKKAIREHGSLFSYKCSDTGVLAWACERMTGARFADLVSSRIWSKLGAEHDASTICDVQGASTPHGGISTTLRDLARWGQMHLQGGTFQGRQLVPRAFIEDIRQNADPRKVTKDSTPPPDYLMSGWAYRSQFWLPEGKGGPYCAWGGYGQICYIHPQFETVIVKFSAHNRFDVELGKLEMYVLSQIAAIIGA